MKILIIFPHRSLLIHSVVQCFLFVCLFVLSNFPLTSRDISCLLNLIPKKVPLVPLNFCVPLSLRALKFLLHVVRFFVCTVSYFSQVFEERFPLVSILDFPKQTLNPLHMIVTTLQSTTREKKKVQ